MPYSVTTAVQVERLYPPELMIEIAAISEIPRSRFRQPERGDQVLREWPLTPNVPL